MARKQKRRGAAVKSRVRPPLPAIPPAAGGSAAIAPRGGRIGGDQALVRAVEMSLGGGVQVRGKGRNRVVLETGDPGIPLDRVPYFTRDLRQIAVVGGLMIALLVIANFTVIPLLVK